MRLEIGRVEDPLYGGAVHGLVGVPVDEFPGQVIEAPACGRAVMFVGVFAREGDDFEPLARGKTGGRPDRGASWSPPRPWWRKRVRHNAMVLRLHPRPAATAPLGG